MLPTPQSKTTLTSGRGALLAPRKSTQRGQAWGTLSHMWTHGQPFPHKDLHTILEGIMLQYTNASISFVHTPTHSILALLFADSSMLVGWTEQPVPPLAHQTQKGWHQGRLDVFKNTPVRFSPVVLRASKNVQYTKSLYTPSYIGITQIAVNAPPEQWAQELNAVVDDARALGPVFAPWDPPTAHGVHAPWILGRARHPDLQHMVAAGAAGMGDLNDSHTISIVGATLRDDGVLDWSRFGAYHQDPYLMLKPVPLQSLTWWLCARAQAPGCPIPQNAWVCHDNNHARSGQATHARVPGRLLALPPTQRSAHDWLDLRSFYATANTW